MKNCIAPQRCVVFPLRKHVWGDPCGIVHHTDLKFVSGGTETAVLSFFLPHYFVWIQRDQIRIIPNHHTSKTEAEGMLIIMYPGCHIRLENNQVEILDVQRFYL